MKKSSVHGTAVLYITRHALFYTLAWKMVIFHLIKKCICK